MGSGTFPVDLTLMMSAHQVGSFSERSCFECIHFGEVQSRDGIHSFCFAYEEPIDSEVYEAEDCSTYEVDQ